MKCELKNDVIYLSGIPLESDYPDLFINVMNRNGYIIRQFNIFIVKDYDEEEEDYLFFNENNCESV